MNLTQLLLKGNADDIASSPLAKGIGPKGAADIVNARNNTTDVLDLVQKGTDKRSVQNTLLETLATEESATFQAGRSSVADMLRQRSQMMNPPGTPVALFGEKSGAQSGAYTPGAKELTEEFFNAKETRDFQYMSGTRGMESPGFKLSPEEQDRLYGIDFAGNYTNEARIDRAARVAKGDSVGLENIPAHEYYGALPTIKGNYDEAVHMRNNNATSTNAMNGGTSGPTPPSSSNTPVNTNTTATGSTNYSGYYQPGETPSSSGLLGSMSQDGAAGVMSSVAFGAAIGGAANYAMGGEFGEGAMMGGIAGGGIKIGARAIQQNQASIESFLQRTALGDTGQNMTRDQAVTAIQGLTAAPEGAGLMQKGAFNMLKSESPSLGMQSRYMVMGGSALAGVTFTGNRKDKRRGFNAHRGNRI